MADVKMIATRESYGNTLKALAAEGHDDLVVLDADLAAATKTGVFRKAHPDRHFDCGIAEANMMGVAAGLSTMGYVPFVSSFAMFAAGRAFEQIRNSVAYPHLNVKIGATHGGISVGEDGASHQCCEGIHARVINIHTIKPLDEDIILKAARECGKIVTAEEHNVIGGLGEAVCSLLSEKLPTPVRRVGVQDKFGCSGPAWDLLKEYGLDAATICKTAKEMLGK